ncbi:hypothetical protein AB0N88_15575 [Streptomyces sp. NPDC093516]|uniref:hypothetical protein n=1 Tax=Streptomyces sp. NPDC093516 TaxID=3155304 RepID=UPI003447E2EC
MPGTWHRDRVGSALRGENPTVLRRLDPGFRRVNLEILGNTDAFLHAHVWPRYDWEPAERVRLPVWLYPRGMWTEERYALGARHEPLRRAIGEELDRLPGPDGAAAPPGDG